MMKNKTLHTIQYLCGLIIIIAGVCLQPQCKKNKNNNPILSDDDTTLRLEPGRYIIRTRYLCPDGSGFILRSLSNYELMQWEPTNPNNVQWQKEANDYIWTVQDIKALSNFGSTAGARVRVGYRLYQTVPNGGYRILGMGRPPSNPDNNNEHGEGPIAYVSYIAVTELPDSLIGPKTPEFIEAHPEYFDGESTTFSIISSADTLYRVRNRGLPFGFNNRGWNDWYMSCTTRPNGSTCDDFKPQPVMRKEITGVGCTFLPDPNRPYYIPDVCYVTQLIFEKVD